MNVFEFVIILVIAVLAFKLWEAKLKNKDAPPDEPENDNVHEQLTDLESRIEVLERIVTDSQYDLKRQFKDLEDDPRDSP